MSDELQRSLDYPSKLTRQPGHIDTLIADGVAQAKAFLAELEAGLAPRSRQRPRRCWRTPRYTDRRRPHDGDGDGAFRRQARTTGGGLQLPSITAFLGE